MTLRQRELTVGNRRVASLEALRKLPTQGIADVYDGQFVIVSNIEYSELTGATNYVELPEQDLEWSAPSDGYVQLDGETQTLEASWPLSEASLSGEHGNTISLWFKLDALENASLLHIPTMSPLNAVNPANPYGIKGLSVNVGLPTDVDPNATNVAGNPNEVFNVYFSVGLTVIYGSSNSKGGIQISRQTGHALVANKWYNLVIKTTNADKTLRIFLNGEQIYHLDALADYEISQILAAAGIPLVDVHEVKLNGEQNTVQHSLLLGAHAKEDGTRGGHLNGSIDEFFYFNRPVGDANIVTTLYADGSPKLGFVDLSQCVHQWSMGDSLPVPTETNKLRFSNNGSILTYLETQEETVVPREETFRVPTVIRPMGETPAAGFAETRSYVSLPSSYKGLELSPGADGGYAVLTSNSLSSAWSKFSNWERGTIAIPFYVDASELGAQPTGKSCLFSLGYETQSSGAENGFRVYISGTSVGSMSLHVELVDSDNTTWSLVANDRVEDKAWNFCVVSFDFTRDDITEIMSLYLNQVVADVRYSSATNTHVKTTVATPTFRKMCIGAIPTEDNGSVSYLSPFYGKVDQVILSGYGDPSAHGTNILLTDTSTALDPTNVLAHWKVGGNDALAINGVYGPSNVVSEAVSPGTPNAVSGNDSFGLDLYGFGISTSDTTTLLFSEGHSGTTLPVPRAVPDNWGTYYYDKDRNDFSEEYSNEPDYGFIVIKPDDRSADQAGRWVSVISYSVWTAYLFGSSQADLRIEEGHLANVEEGDLAVFNKNGKIVPVEPIEQWVSPAFFANATPLPNSKGFKGQRCYDGTYMYECVAPDMWVRYAIANTWE